MDSVDASRAGRQHRRLRAIIALATALLSAAAIVLSLRAQQRVNRTALADSPRPVSVTRARGASYRDSRRYIGSLEAWIEADVGPQFVSAYVQTVSVRPGTSVRKGEVLATLDCTHPSTATRALQMQARAVDERQRAVADETTRLRALLDGGFVAPNDVEQRSALSRAEQARLLESKANVRNASLEVQDCILRSPFDGEIATRSVDPGAFVRPGAAIVSVVDRSTVRVTVDAPEKDFAALAPGTQVQVEVLGATGPLSAPISRTAPKADPKTRTLHFEVDLRDATRRYPVSTTAIVRVDVGAAVPATELPGYATTQASGKAQLFSVDAGVAHARTLPVLGESRGRLFFDPSVLSPGTEVVTQGRELLSDGEHVKAKLDAGAQHGGPR